MIDGDGEAVSLITAYITSQTSLVVYEPDSGYRQQWCYHHMYRWVALPVSSEYRWLNEKSA